MTPKQAILLAVFVVLAGWAAARQGMLTPVLDRASLRRELAELAEHRRQYQALRQDWGETRERLQEANQRLTACSLAYLPEPGDPYAWAGRQVNRLAGETGVRVEAIEQQRAAVLRQPRGEAPRYFVPYRCRVDLLGDLDGLICWVEEAEGRNPYLVVSELYVGPEEGPDDPSRRAHALLDWPMWADPAIGESLLSAFAALNELDADPPAP